MVPIQSWIGINRAIPLQKCPTMYTLSTSSKSIRSKEPKPYLVCYQEFKFTVIAQP